MELKEIKDDKLKQLLQISSNKPINHIINDTLNLAESENQFRELAKSRVEQLQGEITIILSYLNDEKS